MKFNLLIFILFSVAGCYVTKTIPPVAKNFAIDADEKRLWKRSEEEQKILDRSGMIYKDKDLEEYLNQVLLKLQPIETLGHISFRVKVIRNPYLNAFAYPNGALYIHSGVLARMENEAQLASLLAHEMTHSTHRHALRAFRRLKGQNALHAEAGRPFAGSDRAGDLENILGTAGSLAAVTGYSQELENEADMVGLRLMLRAGYDPAEALVLFEHLKRELEEDGREEPFFFGTHPRIQRRIENYKNLLGSRYEGKRGGIKNRDVFLARVQKIIPDNAWVDLRFGRYDSAYRGAIRYLTASPNDPEAYYLLGEISRQRGVVEETKKAKAYYKKAISLDPSYSDPHRGIGLIYFKEGERALAKKSFESYLLLSPSAPDRGYIRRYLRQCDS